MKSKGLRKQVQKTLKMESGGEMGEGGKLASNQVEEVQVFPVGVRPWLVTQLSLDTREGEWVPLHFTQSDFWCWNVVSWIQFPMPPQQKSLHMFKLAG